ncbi:MAG: protein translocase subunit SecD [Candidatus Moraniibacteriota bacterium]
MAIIALPFVQYMPENIQSKFDKVAINLGLDLQGGLHLEYLLDLSNTPNDQKDAAKDAVQAAAERKINAYGVGEPIVWLAERGSDTFMTVEIPGVENAEDVKNVIQKAPILQFKEEKTEEEVENDKKQMEEMLAPMNEENKEEADAVLERIKNGEDFSELAKEFSKDPGSAENGGELEFVKRGQYVPEFDDVLFNEDMNDGDTNQELVETDFGWHIIKKLESRGEGDDREVKGQHILFAKMTVPADPYKNTDLTGEFLDNAMAGYSNGVGASEPQVTLSFNSDGAKMFADITKRNLGKTVAIYVDNQVVSAPTVQAEIVDGTAVISGNFEIEEAKELARSLNEGAMPVPFELVSQQSIEATLGAEALQKGMRAGLLGLVLVMIYMILYYRFFGIIASVALGIYAATLISIFKLSGLTPMSITLTLAGIAGLVLSVGMAVDANVLIFERIKEELRMGKNIKRAVDEGFRRAWPSIRDGNLSTIITSLILMAMGTGFVKGFALILIIGVLVSMFTAIVIVKIIMKYVAGEWLEKRQWLIMPNVKEKLNQNKK